MIPIFYIGDGCGEIHLKMDKQHNFTIKVDKSTKSYGAHGRNISSYNGMVKSLTINGVETDRFKKHRITYPLLCELYKESTGQKLKYRTVVSARTNIERVQELIKLMAPDLRIDFKIPEKEPKTKPVPVDDQIFNFWMNY